MVSHHPPIARFLLVDEEVRLYGTEEPAISLSPNSLIGDMKGVITIEFVKQKRKIYVLTWPFILYGTTIGERKINCQGRGFAFEPESRLLCEVLFNPNDSGFLGNIFSSNKNHKIDEIGGAIYRVKKDVINKFMICTNHNRVRSQKLAVDPSKDIEEFISKIDGVWHNNISFDGVGYWNVDRDSPHILEFESNSLPSDSKYRPDIIYLNMNKKL